MVDQPDIRRMVDYEVTVVPAVCYRVRSPEKNHFAWADAYVREWPGGGSISIQSDFGDFAHTWGSIGPDRFTDFLRSLSFDYFMRKTRPDDYREFDIDLTITALRDAILEARPDGSITRGAARTAWDEIKWVQRNDVWSDASFWTLFPDSETARLVFGNDLTDLPTRTRVNASCQRFWQEIWPVLCDAWLVPAAEIAA